MIRLHGLRHVAIVGTLSTLLAVGCAPLKKSEPADPFMDKWKAKAQESKGVSPGVSLPSKEPVKETAARSSPKNP